MPNCSNCGIYIQPTEVYKREIYVGTTNRVNYGKRVSFGNSKHYRIQSVCGGCANMIDKSNEARKRNLTILILIIAIAIFIYFSYQRQL